MYRAKRTIRRKAYIAAISGLLIMSSAFPASADYTDPKVAAVIEQINGLPTGVELTYDKREQVAIIDDQYQALTDAQKVKVTNIENLLIAEETLRLSLSANHPGQEGGASTYSSDKAAEATNYAFSTTDANNSAVITIHFTSDRDRDGAPDVPQNIILTNPSGETSSLTSNTTHMQDSSMDLVLEWASSAVIMRLSEAAEGQWLISTDIPVTFSMSAYSGTKEEIAEATPTPEPAPVQKTSMMPLYMMLFGMLLIIGSPIALLLYLRANKPKKEPEQRSRTDGVDDRLRPLSEEEEIAQMRDQYMRDRENIERKEAEEREERAARMAEKEERQEKIYVSQEDIDNDETIEEYIEGETDLLNKKQKRELENASSRPKNQGFFSENRFD